mmetsp:Transcript_20248/g.30720  ORF Transcript_20248/g.30720 Transcript_20248/m.30720 type:complete len:81 (-) Transcript_20248:1005-1247(-)
MGLVIYEYSRIERTLERSQNQVGNLPPNWKDVLSVKYSDQLRKSHHTETKHVNDGICNRLPKNDFFLGKNVCLYQYGMPP